MLYKQQQQFLWKENQQHNSDIQKTILFNKISQKRKVLIISPNNRNKKSKENNNKKENFKKTFENLQKYSGHLELFHRANSRKLFKFCE